MSALLYNYKYPAVARFDTMQPICNVEKCGGHGQVSLREDMETEAASISIGTLSEPRRSAKDRMR